VRLDDMPALPDSFEKQRAQCKPVYCRYQVAGFDEPVLTPSLPQVRRRV
jgi:hypothetical protein